MGLRQQRKLHCICINVLLKGQEQAFLDPKSQKLLPLTTLILPVYFEVSNFEFNRVANLVTSLSRHSLAGMLKTKNLYINLTFVHYDEKTNDRMIEQLIHWLDTCSNINRRVRAKVWNGMRMPCNYTADCMFLCNLL